jgi:predicted methyltransferase
MPHDFSDVQHFARDFDAKTRDAWQKPEDVLRLLSVQRGQRVADLGAGTGYFLAPLCDAVGPRGHVLALDAEPNMVQHLAQRIASEQRTNAEARQVTEGDPGLAEGSVDRILVVNAWHHLEGRLAYAAKLARALAPGGVLGIVDFDVESDIGPPPAMRLSAAQVAAELRAAGLTVDIVTGELPKQYVVLGRRS